MRSSTASVIRADVLAQVDALSARLRSIRTKRLIISSDKPADLVAAFLICTRDGVDVFVAHPDVTAGNLEALAATLDVDTVFHSTETTEPAGAKPNVVALRDAEVPPQGRLMLMTSGTTGIPKVAEHDPVRLVDRILASSAVEANRGGRWLLTYQPTTFAGMQVILTACLTGGTIVVPDERTAPEFVDASRRHRVTHVSGTPTFWRSFLMAGGGVGLVDLRQVTLGGEAIDQATLARLAEAYPYARITQIYASTEGGALFAVHDRRPGFPAEWLGKEIQGGVWLRVSDGELQVKSRRGMLRYVDQPTPSTEDGWLRTGDLVRVTEDRALFTGRRDSVVNIGGMKVIPEVVESFVLGLPNVGEAKIRAVPSPISGQVLVADIVVTPGSDAQLVRRAVQQSCLDSLPRHQVPAMVRVVDEITVNASGKKV